MSGFEFLGAVASAAQLVDSGTKTYWWLAEIIRRVRDSPKELQLHAKSIQQLIETARLISYHFHASPELAEHLDSTLIEAENLRGIIQIVVLEYSQGSLRKRCWKAASGSKERKILSGLQKLEQEKSSLLLCLSSVNTKQLFSLQFSIDTLIEDMPKRTTVISGHTYRETEMEYKESTERDEASDEERSSQTTLVVANGSGNSAHVTTISRSVQSATSIRQDDHYSGGSDPQAGSSRESLSPQTNLPDHTNASTKDGHFYGKVTAVESEVFMGDVGSQEAISEKKNVYNEVSMTNSTVVVGNSDIELAKEAFKNARRGQQVLVKK